eukprot:1161838-Pelagomonas_calceolata.AAC.8
MHWCTTAGTVLCNMGHTSSELNPGKDGLWAQTLQSSRPAKAAEDSACHPSLCRREARKHPSAGAGRCGTQSHWQQLYWVTMSCFDVLFATQPTHSPFSLYSAVKRKENSSEPYEE